MKGKEIKEFLWDLYYLLEGNLPVGQALEIITSNKNNDFYNNCLISIKEGYSFAQSLEIAGFKDRYITQILKVAEQGNFLPEALLDLCNLLEEKDTLKSKIIHSLIYPFILTFFAFLTMIFTFTYVIPSVVNIYSLLGIEKNIVVRVFLKFNLGYLLIILTIALLLYNFILYKRKKIYKLLFMGKLFFFVDKYLFYKTLANLLQRGAPLFQSLEIMKEFPRTSLEGDLDKLSFQLYSGKPFFQVLEETSFENLTVVNFIKIAEERGDLSLGISRVENYYKRLLDKHLIYFSKLFEPLIISGVGIMVLIVVFTLLLPIYQLFQRM
ncbi:type II secretion system F family protein [Anaerobranca gottschalkii]|uniref:Type II secretory pathway, component PulF n=1 Tax=Anaerobranca gottschalkii DSM 13577 TaxID=1120990 RepID=A0A1H9Y4D2_9FIRM|nr:type II secretion system F family protein [Anaerobranca gottschalkii]SES63638.1 Type II secretory pathway, component PulF [Anaerobranca gottschalkii DSM 13577]